MWVFFFEQYRFIFNLWKAAKGNNNSLYCFRGHSDYPDQQEKRKFLIHCTRVFVSLSLVLVGSIASPSGKCMVYNFRESCFDRKHQTFIVLELLIIVGTFNIKLNAYYIIRWSWASGIRSWKTVSKMMNLGVRLIRVKLWQLSLSTWNQESPVKWVYESAYGELSWSG